MQKIRVIMLDDHEVFLLGLRMAIESNNDDIEVVGEAGSGAEFFALLKVTAADIALIDIEMPGMNGFDVAKRLKAEYPEMKILAVSAKNCADTIEQMLQIGINGFITKSNCKPTILAEAIHTIMQGLEYFGKDISGIISRIYVAHTKTTQVSNDFSEQEKRIIEYCHQGLPAKLIADRIGITARTVDWYKTQIFRKLGINSTLEMVKFAVKNGIIA
jgi:DNA-binding NarL/FixJ family response regulator